LSLKVKNYWLVGFILLMAGMLFQFQARAALLLSDDFEDGNSGGWSSSSGSWSVATDGGKVFKQSSISANTYAYTGLATWTDYAIQTRLKILSFNGSDRLCRTVRQAEGYRQFLLRSA
jgi:pectate lyase